ncbi:unnamed protein product, partial [Prorocentrum cordatum]
MQQFYNTHGITYEGNPDFPDDDDAGSAGVEKAQAAQAAPSSKGTSAEGGGAGSGPSQKNSGAREPDHNATAAFGLFGPIAAIQVCAGHTMVCFATVGASQTAADHVDGEHLRSRAHQVTIVEIEEAANDAAETAGAGAQSEAAGARQDRHARRRAHLRPAAAFDPTFDDLEEISLEVYGASLDDLQESLRHGVGRDGNHWGRCSHRGRPLWYTHVGDGGTCDTCQCRIAQGVAISDCPCNRWVRASCAVGQRVSCAALDLLMTHWQGSPLPSLQPSGEGGGGRPRSMLYEVSSGLVALKEKPNARSKGLGVLRGGSRFFGVAHTIEDQEWLQVQMDGVPTPLFSPAQS